MSGRSGTPIALTSVWLGAALMITSRPAHAHEFKLESVMTGFVKIEPREAHLVVRVPFHVLRGIKFPLSGAEIALDKADPAIQQALDLVGKQIALFEDGDRLAPTTAVARLSLPSDRSFDSYRAAVSHVASRQDPGTGIYADQGYLDAHLTYAIASPASRFKVRTTMALDLKDYLKLAIRYLPLGETGRAMVITSRSGTVPLNPAWYQAASGFVVLGIAHILSGIDHLLFLLCLVIPLIGLRQVLAVVTAFTVAHSFTLLGAAYGLAPEGAWFPPFVETVIAASIVYMALENIVGADLRRRWLITGLFGLIHGFGFSYGLRENLQFAGRHLVVSLFSFNIGIELGQIAVLILLLPALAFMRRHVRQERITVILLSALVAHTGWHWMLERGEVLWKVEWPELNREALTTLARWVAGVLLAVGIVAFLSKRAPAILSRLRRVPEKAHRPPKVEA
jgi:hypothetical protein